MAIDARIPLLAQVPSLSQSFDVFSNTLLDLQRMNEIEQQPVMNRLLEAQTATAESQVPSKQSQFNQEDRNRIESVVQGAFQLNALPQSQRLQAATSRRDQLIKQGLPTQDTDAFISAMASGDTEGAQSMIDQSIQLGSRLGIVNQAKSVEQFETLTDAQGNITGQRNLTTNKVIADPRAASKQSASPGTPIGKARQDLKNGFITQQDFNDIKSTPSKFQTEVGKTIADKQLAVELFGADSEQVKAFTEAVESDKKGESPSLSDVAGIRKEFTKQSGDFIKMKDAFNKIQSASDTGPGDVSLIFSFMKIIDPGSTVREGEFATAEQTAGIPTRVVNLYNKAIDGDRLGQPQRDAFKAEARNLFDAQLSNQRNLEQVFTGLASRQDIDPSNVVLDFVGEVPDARAAIEKDPLTPEEQAELERLEAQFGNQ